MILRYAIVLAVVVILALFARWALLPARHLPGNRARHLRLRLHLLSRLKRCGQHKPRLLAAPAGMHGC